jgi:general stress protein 26
MGDERSESIARLRDLIKDIRVAMLTTVGSDGALRSRPMMTQSIDFDGTLWFFTGRDTDKAGEIAGHRLVNLSYAEPDHQRFVSMAGTARLLRDPARAEALWSPLFRAWFPGGLDDPNLVLLEVAVASAEYWDASSGRMVALAGFVKSLVMGERATGGDHGTLTLDPSGN